MATVAASLERSLQNCSLNRNNTNTNNNNGSDLKSDLLINQRHRHRQRRGQGQGQGGMTPNNTSYASSSSDDNDNSNSNSNSSTFVQLNSHLSLPYYWEQCLDLKTGELYYINWSTGKKMKEDPRTSATGYSGDYCLSEEEQEHEDVDDTDSEDSDCEEDEESSSCDSQGSSSCSSNRENFRLIKNTRHQPKLKEEELREEAVLVVAGCKSCFMYQMVPKHVDKCPKCQSPHLLHFPANNNSSSP